MKVLIEQDETMSLATDHNICSPQSERYTTDLLLQGFILLGYMRVNLEITLKVL